MSHTPGPWEASRFDDGSRVTLVVDGPASALGDDVDIGPQICDNVFSEEDACLIAAAPELLEALKSLRDYLDNDYQHPEATKAMPDEAMAQADAAIAKAENTRSLRRETIGEDS